MSKQNITAERVRELFNYDPETGFLTWRATTSNRVKVGDRAGCLRADGYWYIKVDGVMYGAHRVIWLLVYGAWPSDQTDHINGNRGDNRLGNLRECTVSENQQNVSVNKRNTSGTPGVFRDKRRSKWRACIHVKGERKHLGTFDHIEDAAAAYLAAKAKFHTFNPDVRA